MEIQNPAPFHQQTEAVLAAFHHLLHLPTQPRSGHSDRFYCLCCPWYLYLLFYSRLLHTSFHSMLPVVLHFIFCTLLPETVHMYGHLHIPSDFSVPEVPDRTDGKHHRFCLFIICNIQCVVPVCEKYFNQTVFTFICNQSVNGCFHMLQHCGFPTILPGCLFFQQCQITSFFDQFTYCPDDPEWLI